MTSLFMFITIFFHCLGVDHGTISTEMSQFLLDGADFTVKDDTGYHRDIASMMHGFGDNPVPNTATVALVESIVLQQLRAMLNEALNITELRNSKVISNADILYLFRNNKVKLKRFHNYITTVDLMKNKTKHLSGNSDNPLVDADDDNNSQSSGTVKCKNTLDIINDMDHTGEVQAIDFDETKYKRNARAAKLTESMSIAKYEAYHKARLVSFGRPGFTKTQHKFKAWLNPNNEYNISSTAYDVLVYLAFETVAEIVDLVFLIRQDAKRRGDDPFSKYSAGNFCNPVSLSNAVYIKSGHEGVPPITVAEVREVLRRVFAPRTAVTGLFYRNMRSELPPKFIAI